MHGCWSILSVERYCNRMNKFDAMPGTDSSSCVTYPNAMTLGGECSSSVNALNHPGSNTSIVGEINTYSKSSSLVLQMTFVFEIVSAKAQAALTMLLFASANLKASRYASLTCLFTNKDNAPVEFITRSLGTLMSLKYGLNMTSQSPMYGSVSGISK